MVLERAAGTFEDTFKKAVLKCGLCGKAYVYNGSVFRSATSVSLALISASAAFAPSPTPRNHGAIERFNRTVAEGFEPEVRAAQVDDLGRINLLFEAWLEQRYHLVSHGTTGEPPLDRFAQAGFAPRFPDPVLLRMSSGCNFPPPQL